jgi:hypothetical protein
MAYEESSWFVNSVNEMNASALASVCGFCFLHISIMLLLTGMILFESLMQLIMD